MSGDSSDYKRLTNIQQHNWATGDIHLCALALMPTAEAIIDATDPHSGQRVLDVACGSGGVALVAARRYCDVIGLDFVPALVERARDRVRVEGVKAEFVVGDAQALPFGDASFDFVYSTFGSMFAPDQEKAATEIARVCRPGGTIGIASWMPEGIGDEFAVVSTVVRPLPGMQPVTRWGTEQGIRELFGQSVSSFQFTRRKLNIYRPSVEDLVEAYRTTFGPTMRAFKAANAAGREKLTGELTRLFASLNRATDGTLILECSYLETIMKR